ncbi:MAG: HAMP domain-containing protein [Candidatus Omnitrophica bacterium]|nr:HAMP domain-containing protein [Candidatus Omnitrophota bacterium]
MSIRNKIFFVSLISFSFLTVTAGIVLYFVSANNLKEEVSNHLDVVARNKASWIRSYISERKKNLSILGQTEDVKQSFQKILVYYKKERFYDLNQKRYKEIYQEMDPFFRSYLETYGYHDIFFISAPYGHVLYRATNDTPLGTNLRSGPHRKSGLAQIWQKVLDTEEVTTVDFSYYEPSRSPAMFIGAPVLDEKQQVYAVVALQLGILEINNVMKDLTGLGQTGDTYLVGRDLLMRSDSRFSHESTILKKKVETEATIAAFSADLTRSSFVQVYDDYRQHSVLGTFVPIPEMGWALIAEMSVSEALAPLIELTYIFSGVGILIIFIIYVISFWIGRRISRPIIALQRGTEIIMHGDLNHRTGIQSSDEIGQLSQAFDRMTARLKGSYDSLEEKVRQRTRELEKVNLELDSFVYTASHDLRAPLRGISSFASFLEEDYGQQLNEEGQDYLKEIRYGADRLSKLIDDLLTLSRISRIRNPYEKTDIRQLIDSVVERIEFDIKEHHVDLRVQGIMPVIMCDSIKLGEVFLNLINNGIKFSSKNNEQSPVIVIGYSEREDAHEFYVKDNGIGIDPRFHDKVFGIFKRLHKEGEYDGTGAGLSIVKRVIDDHGGEIWIDSALGEGTTFFFTIPKGLKNLDQEDR